MDEQEWLQRRENYRFVFGTPEGKEVLSDILNMLGYYDRRFTEPESLVKMTIANEILYRAGIVDGQDPNRMVQVTGYLMDIDPANPYRETHSEGVSFD
jgi:hypothetical protein